MNKLQLYLTISHQGYKEILDINADPAVKAKVCDVTVALEDISYNASKKNFFYLLKSTDEGVFVVILRTIPNNITDHLAAWIYIPNNITVDDKTMGSVLDNVVAEVSKSNITTEEYSRLVEVFSRQYEEMPDPGATVENYGKIYAHRYYGGDTGYTLYDLIGTRRYQISYLEYDGVILADRADVTTITGPDLTDEPLEQMVKIFPPEPDDRYRPLIFWHPFDKPYLVPLMGSVEIVWESTNGTDIKQSIMVNRPNMRPEGVVLPSARIDTPTPRKDEATKAKATESAAPTEIISIPDAPTKAQNKAEATEGPRSFSVDRQRVYNFEIPAKSAAISGMIHFEIQTYSTLTDSPIDGYELSDAIQEGATRSNHLIFTGGENRNAKYIWGVAGLVLGALIALLATCSSSPKGDVADEDAPADSTTTEIPAGEGATAEPGAPAVELPTSVTLEDAVKYLDANPKWDKQTLEAYPDLRGLYDDLNTFNRQRVVDYWGPKLKDSRSFARIADHSEKSLRGKKKPRTKGGLTTFNPPTDQVITVKSYLNAVDP